MRRRALRIVGIGAVALAATAPAAAAHIQVTPVSAAPGDPVEVTVLVPNEEATSTTKVDLQIPKGVLVFSIAETQGWTRNNVEAADGSIGEIVWTGKLAPDGYAKFTFLASMPEEPGEIAWRALQTYAGGETVRWIGDAGSEYPAARTTIDPSAPKQNAGGESPGDGAANGTSESATGVVEPDEVESQSDDQARIAAYSALGLAIVAVLLSGAGLVRRRKS